jgi:hypothetical protein
MLITHCNSHCNNAHNTFFTVIAGKLANECDKSARFMKTRNTSTQLDKCLHRVGGGKPLQRLRWVLGIVNQFRGHREQTWSSGDWENASLELAVFSAVGKTMPGWGVLPSDCGVINEFPSREETEIILQRMEQMVKDAQARRPIRMVKSATGREPNMAWKHLPDELIWNPRTKRYVRVLYDDRATWQDRVTYPLFHLLLDEGHRILTCSSKLPHQGKLCGNYFVKAKRGKYCSASCTAREMTRAKRGRDEKAKQQRQKKGAMHGT